MIPTASFCHRRRATPSTAALTVGTAAPACCSSSSQVRPSACSAFFLTHQPTKPACVRATGSSPSTGCRPWVGRSTKSPRSCGAIPARKWPSPTRAPASPSRSSSSSRARSCMFPPSRTQASSINRSATSRSRHSTKTRQRKSPRRSRSWSSRVQKESSSTCATMAAASSTRHWP